MFGLLVIVKLLKHLFVVYHRAMIWMLCSRHWAYARCGRFSLEKNRKGEEIHRSFVACLRGGTS